MRTTLKRKFRNEYFTCPDWSLIPFHCSIRSSFPHWTVASGRNCGIRHCDDHPVIQRSAGSYRDWPAKSAAAACEAFRQPTGVREFRNEPNVNPNWDARNGPNWMTAHLLLHQPSECNTRKRNTIPNKKHKRDKKSQCHYLHAGPFVFNGPVCRPQLQETRFVFNLFLACRM